MRKILLFFLLCLAGNLSAQNTSSKSDFYDSRNFMGLSFNFWTPFVSNENEPEMFKYKNDKLVLGKDYVDWGLKFEYIHRFVPRFGFGFETGADFFSVNRDSRTTYWTETFYTYNYERNVGYSFSVMPKFELTGKGKFWGTIKHQFGFGFRRLDVVKKTYHQVLENHKDPDLTTEPDYSVTSYKHQGLSFNNAANFGFMAMYSITRVSAVTPRLAIHYGLRLTYHQMKEISYSPKFIYGYASSDREFIHYARQRTQNNFAQLSVGLTYSLDKKKGH